MFCVCTHTHTHSHLIPLNLFIVYVYTLLFLDCLGESKRYQHTYADVKGSFYHKYADTVEDTGSDFLQESFVDPNVKPDEISENRTYIHVGK